MVFKRGPFFLCTGALLSLAVHWILIWGPSTPKGPMVSKGTLLVLDLGAHGLVGVSLTLDLGSINFQRAMPPKRLIMAFDLGP